MRASAGPKPGTGRAQYSWCRNEARGLAATASRRNGSRYRRALTASTAYLDLQDPNQLDLLRRYGPFSTDLRIWVDAPYETRLARGVARDGEESRRTWEEVWIPREERYVERDDPISAAHLIVDGGGRA